MDSKNIDSYTFSGCTNLEDIVIPNSVTSIGDDAFSDCSKLENIVIPDSVTSIGCFAFKNCSKLKNIVLPVDLKNIDSYTFSGCTNLGDIVIPDNVRSIGNNAFKNCSKLKNIVLPNNITIIRENTFEGCINLENIVIPNSVTGIGCFAFKNCSKLKSIVLPNSITSIGENAFEGCIELNNIIIPDSVTRIRKNAFKGCSKLKNVILSNNITAIEKSVFEECINLESIIIPDKVKFIEESAFNGCTSLKEISVPETIKPCYKAFEAYTFIKLREIRDKSVRKNSNKLDKLSNPALDFGISEETYYQINEILGNDIDKITKEERGLVISTKQNDYLYNINTGRLLMFVDMRFYTDNSMDEFIELYRQLNNGKKPLMYFSTSSSRLCDKISAISMFPGEVSKIKKGFFANMVKLEWMFLNEPLEIIGCYAFYYCKNLKGIYIPSSVTTIEDNAFEMCRNLEYVELSNNIRYIGKDVFKDCNKLYIRGHKGSLAEKYAIEYGIKFADIDNDIYDLKDYLTNMGAPKEKLGEINLKINKGCKYNIKDVKDNKNGLIIETDRDKYLLDRQTKELFMIIDFNNANNSINELSTNPYTTFILN